MNAMPDSAPIAPGVVDCAIVWHVRQASGQMSQAEQAALADWLAQHPDHARAWQRLQHIGEHLRQGRPELPADVTRAVFERLPDKARRRALRLLSWATLGGVGMYLAREPLGRAAFPADHHTAVGERRDIRLADGTLLRLNTDSAVDIRFDNYGRQIRLRRGDIQVVTAPDPAGRPFWVDGRDGRLTPVGTRFTVSQRATHTLLGVSEGAVDVLANGHGEVQRVGAGQQLAFGHADSELQRLDESQQAWTDGMLSAENRRLDDLLAELGRHRAGYLGCSPEAGALRITGVWPLRGDDPTPAILASLERRLPIRVQQITRYWVSISRR